MKKTDEIKRTYFQYCDESNLPVYLLLNLQEFTADLKKFFGDLGFKALSNKEAETAEINIIKNPRARVLKISEATPYVAKQIDGHKLGPGAESVVPGEGYFAYRYCGRALIVYSFRAKEWSMGCFADFAGDHNDISYKIIINRYLSWALLASSVAGFWGVPVAEGLVVMTTEEARGEATFVNLQEQKILSIEGQQKIQARFNIMRLNASIRGKNIRMSQEELLSFLSINTSYFGHHGLSVPLRQIIQMIAKTAIGLIHPEESYRPRADLSL